MKETDRLALRESQEARALDIENKRRVAKGEEPLESLEEETDEETETEGDALVEEVSDEEDDVLLQEAGNVLVDALLIKQRRFAAHTPEGE